MKKMKPHITALTTPLGEYTVLVTDTHPNEKPTIKLLKWRRKNEIKKNNRPYDV